MEAQYRSICSKFGCTAKIFTKERGALKKKIGCPDLLILFMNTVSHKMALGAIDEARRNKTPYVRVCSSSASALRHTLCEYCEASYN
jgi:hypothetical protein